MIGIIKKYSHRTVIVEDYYTKESICFSITDPDDYLMIHNAWRKDQLMVVAHLDDTFLMCMAIDDQMREKLDNDLKNC